jgi:hypothetical protein
VVGYDQSGVAVAPPEHVEVLGVNELDAAAEETADEGILEGVDDKLEDEANTDEDDNVGVGANEQTLLRRKLAGRANICVQAPITITSRAMRPPGTSMMNGNSARADIQPATMHDLICALKRTTAPASAMSLVAS